MNTEPLKGVPTEQSTIPPATAAATERRSTSRSCGYGGGTKPRGLLTGTRSGYPRRLRSAGDGLAETSEVDVVDSCSHSRAHVVVHLDQHLAVAMQGGENVPSVVGDDELDHRGEGSETIGDR